MGYRTVLVINLALFALVAQTNCGGTLISKNLVLTAAHCGVTPGFNVAMVGEHDVENIYDQQNIGIKQEIKYPSYKGT